MTRPILLLAIVLLAWPLSKGRCAIQDESSKFFTLTNVWTIHLTFEGRQWATLESTGPDKPGQRRPMGPGNFRPGPPDRRGPDGPGPGPFQRDFPWSICTFECGGQVLTNVAIRFKGHSSFAMSRDTLKRPFKVDFNRGHKGRSLLGVKELSLNNNFNDSTQFREALGYEVCRQSGLPAPRTAFAKVYLTIGGQHTNEFLGLYTLAEPVESDFLQSHFGTHKGLLLKPERLPTLEYLGENWSAYTNSYQPKTSAKPDEIQRFLALTRLIAQADAATLESELPRRIDMPNLFRYLAVNALLANYDSFIGNGHNYYLFLPANDGKAVFVPWDLNEAFGGHPPLGPRMHQAELTVLRPQAGQNRFIERILANPKWAAQYRIELTNLLAGPCTPDQMQAAASQLAALVRDAVFAESPLAKAMFQRTALGQTNVVIPAGPVTPGGRPPRVDPREPPFADWISARMRNATEELAGKRTGDRPQMRGFGPPGFRP